MEQISRGIALIFSRKDSRLIFILATLVFFILLLCVENGKSALTAMNFDTLNIFDRISLSIFTLFDITNTFSISSLILSTLGSLLGGVNISLAFTYMKTRGEIILKSGLYSGLGLFFAFLGIGCAACGTALFAVILSFLGLSTMIHTLPYEGQEIGYIGIIFLCMATYSLASKVTAPGTC